MKYIRSILAILCMTLVFCGKADTVCATEAHALELKTAQEEQEMIKANATMEKKYTSTTHVKNFGYWVYRPTVSKDEKLPLIVYMHGIGERGNNLDKMLNVSLPMHLYKNNVAVNAVVIMPQCPASTNWTNLADDVIELINLVKEEENIDDTSISLTGHSLGGIGTWKIALKYPDVFASLVPVSSTINSPNECTKLVDTPIWSFHGSKDTMTPTSMLQAQKVIEAAGGTKMEVTMFMGQGHCITDLVYNNPEYDILNWMASQHREVAVEE